MKNLLFTCLMCVPMMLMAQQKVAVYVTSSTNDVDEAAKQIIGTELVSAIIETKQYDAVERTSDFLKQISTEQGYQRSGNVDDQQISALGKQFGVDYVCVANLVIYNGSKYYIQARLIDVETATVQGVARETSSIDNIDDMILASSKVASTLFNIDIVDHRVASNNNANIQNQQGGSGNEQSVFDKIKIFFKGNNNSGTQQVDNSVNNANNNYSSGTANNYNQTAVGTNAKGIKVKGGSLKKVPQDFIGHYVVGDDVVKIEKRAFDDCTNMTGVTIGNNVSSIGEDAFHGCLSLTEVTIPASVCTIGNDAFHGCVNLTSVTILNANIILGDDIFSKCTRLNAIYVPRGTKARFENIISHAYWKLIIEK